ncbi:hypothetical protein [Yoonia sp. MH D7]
MIICHGLSNPDSDVAFASRVIGRCNYVVCIAGFHQIAKLKECGFLTDPRGSCGIKGRHGSSMQPHSEAVPTTMPNDAAEFKT